MENKIKVERTSFCTAAQLIAAFEKIGRLVSLDQMYIQDSEGIELDTLEVLQETLSDGSIVFDVILSTEGDPNS